MDSESRFLQMTRQQSRRCGLEGWSWGKLGDSGDWEVGTGMLGGSTSGPSCKGFGYSLLSKTFLTRIPQIPQEQGLSALWGTHTHFPERKKGGRDRRTRGISKWAGVSPCEINISPSCPGPGCALHSPLSISTMPRSVLLPELDIRPLICLWNILPPQNKWGGVS
jgi:hypothetical protein